MSIVNTPKVRSAYRLGGVGLNARLRCGNILQTIDIDGRFSTHQYAMVCILSGSGTYYDEKQNVHPFKAPCIIQRIPDKIHSISWDEPTQTIYIAAPFDVYDLLKTVTKSDKLNTPVLEYTDTEEFMRESDIIYKLLKNLPEDQLMIAVNSIQNFFTKIIQGDQREQPSIISLTDKFLEDKLPCKVFLSELAYNFSMSESSFKSKFTKAAGVAPGKYIIIKRLEMATELLAENKLSIGEIAEHLEYADIYTFSRQFKKYYGMTPTIYRKYPNM